MKLNTHFHLVPGLRMSGGTTPLLVYNFMESKGKTLPLSVVVGFLCFWTVLNSFLRYVIIVGIFKFWVAELALWVRS